MEDFSRGGSILKGKNEGAVWYIWGTGFWEQGGREAWTGVLETKYQYYWKHELEIVFFFFFNEVIINMFNKEKLQRELKILENHCII